MGDNSWSFAEPDGSFLRQTGSSGVNVTTAAYTVSRSRNAGKTTKLNRAAGIAAVLPKAVGSDVTYRFVVGTTFTGDGTIAVANATDVMRGSVNILDNDAAAQTAYAATGTDDTLTMNGTTKGGLVGDWVEFTDTAAGVWQVRGQLVVPAGSNPADVFSATVS